MPGTRRDVGREIGDQPDPLGSVFQTQALRTAVHV